MILTGTLHKRDLGQGSKWYFVLELPCDIGIGVMIPNDDYIKTYGIEVSNDDYTENQIVNADWNSGLKLIKICQHQQ